MAERESSSLRRFAVEVFTIVAGILLAFGLQAWWEGQQRASEEADLLERLNVEFAATDSILRVWQAHQARVVEAGRKLLEQTSTHGQATISMDSVAVLISAISFNWTFDPPDAVLSSAIASGDLGLIRDPTLRAALSAYPAALADLRGDEGEAAEIVNGQLKPFLDARIARRTPIALGEAHARLTPSEFPLGADELLRDRQFESLVAGRVALIAWIVGEYSELASGVSAIRMLVEGEVQASR